MDNLPKGWEEKFLPDVVLNEKHAIKRGPFGSALKKEFFVNSGYKVYEQKNAIHNNFNIGEYFISDEKFKELSAFEIKSGDFIISCSGTIGKIALAPENIEKGIINQALLKISLDAKKISKAYYKYFFENYVLKGELESNIKGAAIRNIASVKELKQIPIPLPPLPEQKSIVSKLDALFERIDKSMALLEENIKHIESLMASALDEIFADNNWVYKQLQEITLKIGSGSTPKGGQNAYKTEGISLIRSMNVHDGVFKHKGLAFIDEKQAAKLSNVEIKRGDVLLNITGASVARCCIVDNSILPARVNQHVSIIRTNEILNPYFLQLFLISPKTKSALLFSSSGGATREAITKTMINNFEVPVPPISEQRQIVKSYFNIKDKIDIIKTEQQAKLANLKALKESILDKAFKGEL